MITKSLLLDGVMIKIISMGDTRIMLEEHGANIVDGVYVAQVCTLGHRCEIVNKDPVLIIYEFKLVHCREWIPFAPLPCVIRAIANGKGDLA